MLTNSPKWTKLVFVGVTIAATTALLAGCSSSTTGSGTAAKPAVKIAAVIKGLDNPFFQAMEDGVNHTAKTDKVTANVQAAADITDTAGQADKLSTMAGQDYTCFVVNPISATNLIQGLAQVSTAKKTIINIDNPIDAAAAKTANLNISTYIGTDNVDAGKKAGAFVTSKVAAGSKVAIIGGLAGDVTSNARVTGFKSAVSGLTVVQEVAADWDRSKALTAATNIIAANPAISAIFAANDDMGLGVAKAVANAGLTGKIVVISVDGNKEALQSIAAGGLTATVAQYPFAVGALGVQACEVAAAGKTLPKSIVSPTALVTKDNADKAVTDFPQPFAPFTNPLTALLASK